MKVGHCVSDIFIIKESTNSSDDLMKGKDKNQKWLSPSCNTNIPK